MSVALLALNKMRCQRLDVSLCSSSYLFDVTVTSSTGSAPRQHVRGHVICRLRHCAHVDDRVGITQRPSRPTLAGHPSYVMRPRR